LISKKTDTTTKDKAWSNNEECFIKPIFIY
jgi:hypothetical protein